MFGSDSHNIVLTLYRKKLPRGVIMNLTGHKAKNKITDAILQGEVLICQVSVVNA